MWRDISCWSAGIPSNMLSDTFSASNDTYSDRCFKFILANVSSDVIISWHLFWHNLRQLLSRVSLQFLWHLSWHLSWHIYILTYFLTCPRAYLLYIRTGSLMPTFIATVSLTNFLDSFRTSLYSDNFLTYILLAMKGEEGRGEESRGKERRSWHRSWQKI